MRFILRTGGQGTPDFHFDFVCEDDRSQFEALLNFGLDLADKRQRELDAYAATLWPNPASSSVTDRLSGVLPTEGDKEDAIGRLR